MANCSCQHNTDCSPQKIHQPTKKRKKIRISRDDLKWQEPTKLTVLSQPSLESSVSHEWALDPIFRTPAYLLYKRANTGENNYVIVKLSTTTTLLCN